MKICILDYGSGNVTSVFNMLKFIEFEPEISNKKKKNKRRKPYYSSGCRII